jgi:hypothetical protein
VCISLKRFWAWRSGCLARLIDPGDCSGLVVEQSSRTDNFLKVGFLPNLVTHQSSFGDDGRQSGFRSTFVLHSV